MRINQSLKLWPLLSLALLAQSPVVHASEQIGRITYLAKRTSDGLISLELTGGARLAKPPCAIYNYFLIRDENSASGKQQFAMLLAAQLAGKSVRVIGANTCVRWLDGEDIESVQTLDN